MAVGILLIILVSVFAAPVSASEVTMTFDRDHVRVKTVLSLHQNMTDFPEVQGNLSLPQASDASAAITGAVKKLYPTASLTDLTLDLNSSKAWLNLTLTVDVSGIVERSGDISTVNTTWRAFNTSADLRYSNLSYNAVGRAYLRPVISFYVNASQQTNKPNATIKGVNFFVNQTQAVDGPTAEDQVGNFTILDFRSLGTPLEQWNRTYNLQNNTTTWRYTPLPLLGASVKVTKLNGTLEILADLSYMAQITVPGLARLEADLLYVDIGTGQKELLMAVVVVLAVAAAIVAQFLYRARRKAVRLKRR